MYVTKAVIGSLLDFRNLDFILPLASSYTSPEAIPLTIVFHDSVKQCADAAKHHDILLPQSMCGTGIVMHYHSYMLPQYLERTYKAFQNGSCHVLHPCA